MKEQNITQFDESSVTHRWKTITDNVMGGISSGSASIQNGVLHFSGKISLANNGGFAMVRSEMEPFETSEFNAFKLRVKGDGKQYQFRIKIHAQQKHAYIHHFNTTQSWQTIIIPFKSLKPWFRGNLLKMDDFEGPSVSSVAFLLGNKIEESFHLQIESISLIDQP